MSLSFLVTWALATIYLDKNPRLSVTAQETIVLSMEAACRQINENGMVLFCNTREQLNVLAPLAAVVYPSHYQSEKDAVQMHLYPFTFKIRHASPMASPSDSLKMLSNLAALSKCNVDDGYMILERAPNVTTSMNHMPGVSKLSDHIIPVSHYLQAPNSTHYFIGEGAKLFQKCVHDGLLNTQGGKSFEDLQRVELALVWVTLRASHACNHIAEEYFQKISTELENVPPNAKYRENTNLILRLITAHWGHPGILANLILLFQCKTDDSYDEFLSCVIDLSDIKLSVNVFQRNVDPKGKPWKCETCSLHMVSAERQIITSVALHH
jgi:hypothetical protein